MLDCVRKLFKEKCVQDVDTAPFKDDKVAGEKAHCCSTMLSCCTTQDHTDKQGENDHYCPEGAHYIIDEVQTDIGGIPKVSCTLSFEDVLGSWKARWGINRMTYKVAPGLYCVGNADRESPVIISANYKMSFDVLRRELNGLDAWIVVLDTKGINVWCAAGKGTFGTEELINRLMKVNLAQIVSHRIVIVPQLAAPGVAAHEVYERSGFKVVYGPVRASDIPAFLAAGLKAAPEMRRIHFTFSDRLVLTPMELVGVIKPFFITLFLLFVLKLMGFDILSFTILYPYLGAVLLGCVIVPALLPWIPGRAFSWKGWLAGAVWVIGVGVIDSRYLPELYTWKYMLIYFLTVPAVSSYLALNFTGCSTYTSISGVLKEMKLALPVIGGSFLLGIILTLAGLFIHF